MYLSLQSVTHCRKVISLLSILVGVGRNLDTIVLRVGGRTDLNLHSKTDMTAIRVGDLIDPILLGKTDMTATRVGDLIDPLLLGNTDVTEA